MLNKGLCINCENEKSCIFVKKPVVLECEEFDAGETRKVSSKKKQV